MIKKHDAFQQAAQEHGRTLIMDFSRLVRMTSMYDSMNQAIHKAASKVLSEIESFLAIKNELTIKMVEGSFYIQDARVRPGVTDVETFTVFAEELRQRSIGVLTFRAPLQTDDLIYLAYAIKGGSEISEVQSALESRLTKAVAIGGAIVTQKESDVEQKDTRAVARSAYIKAISSFMEIDSALRTGKPMNLKSAKKALQSIVDCIEKDESYVLGLTAIRNEKNYYYQHSVNVAVLSAALGRRVGLSKYELSRLAIAALLHDIGKVEIPLSILNKRSEFKPGELELIKRHPVDGIRHVLRTHGLTEASLLAMLVSFEHHIKLDFSGYPEVSERRTPILFSRIVSITDWYDTLVSGLVYEKKPLSPEKTLHLMYEQSGKQYDGILMKAFIEIFAI